MTTYETLVDATLAARRDAARRPAAQDDHAGRRRHRARHRVDVVPARAAARVGARDGRCCSPERRRRHRDAGRGARRPVRRVPQLLRHAGLRAAPGDRRAAGRAATSGCEHRRASTRRPGTKAITDVCDLDRRRRRSTSSTAPSSTRDEQYLTAGQVHRRPPAARARATTPGSRSSTAPSTSAPRTYLTVARLHLALGHRLVLVLARAGRAEPGGPPAVAAALPPLRRLPPHRGPRPPHGLSAVGSARSRAAAGGAGRAGRRDPGASGSPEFLDAFHREVGISPVWLCPIRLRGERTWPLYPMSRGRAVRQRRASGRPCRSGPGDPEAHNRLIEQLVADLGGHKSLYSTVHYAEDGVLAALQRARLPRGQGALRPATGGCPISTRR